ncbi:GIY-YIG nuclease family protein [Anabaena subtropica]|uniref:GIY-YIG nuclease family protein n=1 Tax=Anabaena subtropica FACHB-260 TaxID=2692884 RepID=A0ABR8CQV1_9NOST|nr:GIY-YIG nuclease family protein [Anabaena subtropica]MBD2345161.1 GIY-YIG nuclease family protein [Anabaena subtropica FACHB-260]
MVCGIYQIVNTSNGKSYIGQSRSIHRRWREHTRGLNRPNALEIGNYPLRCAFLKYGLTETVSTSDKIGWFDFRIIEQCTEDKLLEREQFWINTINPEYNCNIWTPARKKNKVDSEKKFWIQYHNYNSLGYLPVEHILDEYLLEEYDYDEVLPGISTNKRAVLNTKGDTIFLIVGIGEKPKQYYLWSAFICEEKTISEYEDSYFYGAFGSGHLMKSPQLLNSKEFNEFKSFCGNFGFGFMRIKDSPYLNRLKELSENHKPKSLKFNFKNYIKDFYAQVTCVNPKEFSAYHRRGFSRHLAVSLHPETALPVLAGECTVLLICEPTNHVLKYKGSTLLIHILEFYDEEKEQEYIESYELNEETFSIYSIAGWITVENVFKYDAESFAADRNLHLQENDFRYYQTHWGDGKCDIWGIYLKEPVVIKPPICNVFQPEGIYSGDIWQAENLSHLEVFQLALKIPVNDE